jgi:rhamnogalacturonyl hydrolase YesR
MKKLIFAGLSLLALLGFVSCSKTHETQQENTKEATATEKPKEEGGHVPVPTKNPIQGTPLEVIQKVADRIIALTAFRYRLILQPNKQQFDFVKYIDFGRTYGYDKSAVAYATTTVESTVDTTMSFDLSFNDGLKMWVNGQEVFAKMTNQAVQIVPRERDIVMTEKVMLTLKKGANTILFKSVNSGKHDKWQVYFQPTGAVEWQSPIKNLRMTLENLPDIDEAVSKISSWLVIGTFSNKDNKGFATVFPPEKEFYNGALYENEGKSIAWGLPHIELYVDVIGADPRWGSFYNYNYHTAGTAWGMATLADLSGNKKYDDFARKYCDFMTDNKKYINYQVNTLNGFQSANHHQVNTPLLDFTSAPAMPFIYRLRTGKEFNNNAANQSFVKEIQQYLLKDQVRFEDGTFTRYTPEKFTTWTDDMYMGIPFLIQSALLAQDEKEKKMWFDDAARQIIGFTKRTQNKATGLYRHGQYSEREAPILHWTRAQGWATFAMAEVLTYLPKNHALYDTIQTIFTNHLRTCLTFQQENGLWHNVIDKPETFLETSGSALLVFGLARGLNIGVLDKKEFEAAAIKGWEGLKTQIEADGTVHNIIVGTGISEDVNYYHHRALADDDSHGQIGLFFGAMEMHKLMNNK